MNRMILGSTGLEVSRVALGTADFGLEKIPEKQAFEQMDKYTSLGGNVIDTAEVYNNWVEGEKSRSEKIIGRWLEKTGIRSRVVLSTKGGHPLFESMTTPRLSNQEIKDDLSRSLDNLKTDRIDLYFLHRDDVRRPVEELIDLLEEQKQSGLIRNYGFSNWTLERAEQARSYAQKKGIKGFSVNQILWSPARIRPETIGDKTLVPMSEVFHQYHAKTGMAAMAYTSQGKGYFSKRYQDRELSETLREQYSSRHNDEVYSAVAAYCDREHCDPSEVIVRWFMAQPFPALPIISASSLPQLELLMSYEKRALPPLGREMPLW